MISNILDKFLYREEKLFVYTLHIYTDDVNFIEYTTDETNLEIDFYISNFSKYDFLKMNGWFVSLKTIQSIRIHNVETKISKIKRLKLSW